MDVGAIGIYFCLFLGLYFEVFLFISFLEKVPRGKVPRLPNHFPSVSIVVPCFNEEKTLAATLHSLLQLEYPKDKLDIIIVDDGSKDGTRNIAEDFASRHKEIRYFHKENGGKYTAFNLGIQSSHAELVGCLDADSFVAEDALLEVVKKFEEKEEAVAVVPAMKVHHPKNLLELMQSVEYTFGIFVKKTFDNLDAISVLPGPFSIYRRSLFDRIGLLRHAHNTEDMEIAFRIHEHGLKIANAHTAIVYTTVPKTVRTLVKQRTRWSQGFLQNSQDYSHMYFNKKYGNFGLFVLPFGFALFMGALYCAGYALYQIVTSLVARALDTWVTGVLPNIASVHITWFYVDTSMMTFLIITTLSMTFAAILMGRRISGATFGIGTLLSYFLLYGFIAPIWLSRAAWGTLRSRESVWR